MPVREAEARWEDSLRDGKGSIHGSSGAFDVAFTFRTRFESDPGTNPEELIGAAHAGCFSMALASALGKAGHVPEEVRTTAGVHLEKHADAFEITGIDLATRARVPGLSEDELRPIAEEVARTCPVSKALAAVPIRVDATLAA